MCNETVGKKAVVQLRFYACLLWGKNCILSFPSAFPCMIIGKVSMFQLKMI